MADVDMEKIFSIYNKNFDGKIKIDHNSYIDYCADILKELGFEIDAKETDRSRHMTSWAYPEMHGCLNPDIVLKENDKKIPVEVGDLHKDTNRILGYLKTCKKVVWIPYPRFNKIIHSNVFFFEANDQSEVYYKTLELENKELRESMKSLKENYDTYKNFYKNFFKYREIFKDFIEKTEDSVLEGIKEE